MWVLTYKYLGNFGRARLLSSKDGTVTALPYSDAPSSPAHHESFPPVSCSFAPPSTSGSTSDLTLGGPLGYSSP